MRARLQATCASYRRHMGAVKHPWLQVCAYFVAVADILFLRNLCLRGCVHHHVIFVSAIACVCTHARFNCDDAGCVDMAVIWDYVCICENECPIAVSRSFHLRVCICPCLFLPYCCVYAYNIRQCIDLHVCVYRWKGSTCLRVSVIACVRTHVCVCMRATPCVCVCVQKRNTRYYSLTHTHARTHIHTYTYTHTHNTCTHTHTHTCDAVHRILLDRHFRRHYHCNVRLIGVHKCVCVCMYMPVYMHIHACVYVCVNACMNTYRNVCEDACVCKEQVHVTI